jgi:hypothetical protein
MAKDTLNSFRQLRKLQEADQGQPAGNGAATAAPVQQGQQPAAPQGDKKQEGGEQSQQPDIQAALKQALEASLPGVIKDALQQAGVGGGKQAAAPAAQAQGANNGQ